MRVAQVVTYISADGAFGGPVAVAIAQSVELARQGHDVALYAAWDGVAVVEAPGVTLRLFKINGRRRGRSLTRVTSGRLLLDLRRRQSHFDVIHLHFGRDVVSMSTWLVLRGRRAKTVLQTHGMVVPDDRTAVRFVDALIVARALRTARAVLALTDQETENLVSIAGALPNLRRIDNGVAFPAQAEIDRPSSPRVVLFLARLHQRKNVLQFAEAARLAHLVGLAARFRVIGPDEGDLPALKEFISRHRLQGYLEYGGSVGPGGSQHELAAASVYVLPSHREVYPMTVLEAIAVGTPVVLSEDCGLSPALAEAEAAVIVRPEPAELVEAVSGLLNDEAYRRSVAERAICFGTSRYSITAVATALLGTYGAPTGARESQPHQ